MIARRNYKGIDFIRVQDLSDELKSGIREWLTPDVVIKIKTDDDLFTDCIQLKDFIFWYENLYAPTQKKQVLGKTHLIEKRKPLSLILQS